MLCIEVLTKAQMLLPCLFNWIDRAKKVSLLIFPNFNRIEQAANFHSVADFLAPAIPVI